MHLDTKGVPGVQHWIHLPVAAGVAEALWVSQPSGSLKSWESKAKPYAKPSKPSQVQRKKEVGGSGWSDETTPGPQITPVVCKGWKQRGAHLGQQVLLMSTVEVLWAYHRNTSQGGCPPDDPSEASNQHKPPTVPSLSQTSFYCQHSCLRNI